VSDLVELLQGLVEIDSINPDLIPGAAGEAEIARSIAEWCERAGLEVEVEEAAPGRPNVISTARGTGGGRTLLLNAHMDTVGIDTMDAPFDARVEDGRLYGRGSYDMKGSLAAIMIAAREAKKLKLHGDLIVAAVADEEVASVGTAAVLKRVEADAAIVTEPTEMRLCLAHKGFAWLEVETRGVAAHGSRADLGVDAVGHMGRILTGVLELDRRLRAGRGHLLLGTGTIHASLIEGGQELSTYPARCVVKLERRTIPGEDGASALREIEEVIAAARVADPALEASAELLMERPPSQLGADSFVTEAVEKAATEELRRQPEVIGVAYWMDMALSNAMGIPTVAFGPSGEGAHADVEWVDLASLETCVQVYLRAAELLCA
jgi:acetylornithine deacetylase